MDNNKNIELISSLIYLAASKNLLKKAVFYCHVERNLNISWVKTPKGIKIG